MSSGPNQYSPPARRLGVGAALGCVLALLWLSTPPPVLAHAALERADPTPASSLAVAPRAVTLWFTEPVVGRYSRIAVLAADGRSVAAGEPFAPPDSNEPALRLDLQPDLPDGAYTVVWSVYSRVDAHISEGVFSFTVGVAGLPTPEQEAALAADAFAERGVPRPLDTAARWLNLLGEIVLFGALAFVPLVLVPIRAPAIPSRRFRRVIGAALLALALGHLASAVVQVVEVTGGDLPGVLGRPLLTLLTETRFGALWLSRAVLIVALALLAWTLTRGTRVVAPRRAGAAGVLWALTLVSALLLLLTTSLGSHAAAVESRPRLAIALDWAHLVAAGVWLGGLVCLVTLLPALPGPDVPASDLLKRALARFGRVAALAGGVLLLTGLLAARRQIGGWDGIVVTRYGMWFTIKLVVIAAALGLAAWRPVLARTRGQTAASRTLAGELALGAVIVLAAAAMTASVPAVIELARVEPVYAETVLTGDTSITLRAAPGKVGTNEFSVVVAPAEREFTPPPDQVTLVFEPGGSRLPLHSSSPADPWTFRAAGEQIDARGDWTITALIVWPDAPEEPVTFDLEATVAGFYPAGFAPAKQHPSTLTALLGFGWIAIGLALGLASRRIQAQVPALGWALLALAGFAVLIGAAIVLIASAGT